MDFDRAISDLPLATQAYLKSSLADHHLREDDPIAAIVLVIESQMNRLRRNWLFGGVIASFLVSLSGLIFWNFGVASGRSSALSEVYKARPMVTFTVPGTSVLYGIQAGPQTFMVDCTPRTVESTRVSTTSKGIVFISVK